MFRCRTGCGEPSKMSKYEGMDFTVHLTVSWTIETYELPYLTRVRPPETYSGIPHSIAMVILSLSLQ